MKEFILLLPEFFLTVTLAGLVFAEVGYHGERVRLISATALLGLGGRSSKPSSPTAMERPRSSEKYSRSTGFRSSSRCSSFSWLRWAS